MEQYVMRYSYKDRASLSKAQQAYVHYHNYVVGENLSQTVTVKLTPETPEAVQTMEGLALIPVSGVRLTALADYPKAGRMPNRRAYTRGDMGVEVIPGGKPWRCDVAPIARQQMDLGVGPLVQVQQVRQLETDAPIVSPRTGDVYISTENGRATITVGIYMDGNRVCPCRLAAFAVGDVPKVRVCGATIGKLDPQRCIRIGRVRPGDTVLEFTEEVKLTAAKFGIGGEPTLEPNSELAMPADAGEAAECYRDAMQTAFAGSQLPTAQTRSVRVYEVCDFAEFQAGLISTDWRVADIVKAVAGRICVFEDPVAVLADRDMEVISVERAANGRHRIVCAEGEAIEYPAGVSMEVVPGTYAQYDRLGVWTQSDGEVLDTKSILDSDVFRMLRDLTISMAIVCDYEDGATLLYAPYGLLGSLAKCDDANQPMRFIACDHDLWDGKAYVLPSCYYDGGAVYGTVRFAVLLPKADKRFDIVVDQEKRPSRPSKVSR